jgi:hypothetical protein
MSRLRRELQRHRAALEEEGDAWQSSASDDSFIPPDAKRLDCLQKILMFGLWSSDEREVFAALGTLADIEDADERQEVFDNGGPYIVVAAMNKWYNSREIIIDGMRAVANLGANTPFRDAAVMVGAMDVVLLAMENFSDCPIIQRNACAAICRLCLESKFHAAHFVGELGGLEMLTYAMKRFPDNVSMQKWAVLALYDFCTIEQLRKPIVRCGGVKALEYFMNKYQNTKDCQEVWTKAETILVDIGAINELNRVNAKRKLRAVVKLIIAVHLFQCEAKKPSKKTRGSAAGSRDRHRLHRSGSSVSTGTNTERRRQ